MDCGKVCSVGKVTVMRHAPVKRENLDSAWTQSETQVLCCSEVLFCAKIHFGTAAAYVVVLTICKS